MGSWRRPSVGRNWVLAGSVLLFSGGSYTNSAEAADGAAAASTSGDASGTAAASPTAAEQGSYFRRYRPQANTWELGGAVNLLFLADAHNLKEPSLASADYAPVVGPSFRLSYFPLSFLGVEADWLMGFSRVQGQGAHVLGLRGYAIAQLPFYSMIPFVSVGGGFLDGSSQAMGRDLDGVFSFGAGVKLPLSELVLLRFDLRDNLAQKIYEPGQPEHRLVHHIELALGASVRLGKSRAAGPPDRDRDGVSDSVDLCPEVAALTANGCPADRDNDGVVEGVDECPLVSAATKNGCPTDLVAGAAADEDGDGIPSNEDACPTQAEVENGIEDEDGCPDELPAALMQLLGPARGIMFEANGSEPFDTSLATLNELGILLLEYPRLRIEVTGHTAGDAPQDSPPATEETGAVVRGDAADSADVSEAADAEAADADTADPGAVEGGTVERDAPANGVEGADAREVEHERRLALSRARAERVKALLVERGVEAGRIETGALGDAEPLTENRTPQERAENDRVEIRLLAPAPSSAASGAESQTGAQAGAAERPAAAAADEQAETGADASGQLEEERGAPPQEDLKQDDASEPQDD